MKLLALTAAVVLLAVPAFAEGRGGNRANSASNSEAVAIVDAQTSSGAASVINYPADTTVEYSGEIRSAPALGGLALGGGHPCAYSPVTGQLSIIGGGAGVGGMKVDSACMLMVMGYGDARAKAAAEYMIAARDPAACNAMKAAGMVADCVGKGGTSTTSTKNAPAIAGATFKTCAYDAASNKLTVSKAGGATIQIAARDCKASLGM